MKTHLYHTKILWIVLLVSITLIFLSACQTLDSSKKPNIVFIFTDDQTYTSVHALGNNEIITPNIDRLVHMGTTFSNAYNMGAWNGAVCQASRAMLNSGRTVWNANIFRQKWIKRDTTAINQIWSKILEGAGYSTYMTGKWHVDIPAHEVFQTTKDVRPGMPRDNWNHHEMVKKFKNEVDGIKVTADDIMPIGYNRPLSPSDNSWSPTDTSHGGFWAGGTHWSRVVRDNAISFIDNASLSDNPFFMYLAFNAPHDPRQAPQSYIDMYPLDKLSVPTSFLSQYPNKKAIGNGQDLRDEALAPYPRTEYAIKVHKQEYYASITYLDYQVGKILDHLEETDQMTNTYIIFTSDHGLAIGKHGLIGKQSLYDHSVRVPLIITGPDIPKNVNNDTKVYLQDIMATTIDIAGIEQPSFVDFSSFLDIAKDGQETVIHENIYGAYIDYQRMIQRDGKKLIIYPKLDKLLLYDMSTDPEEIIDISNMSEHKDTVIKLFGLLVKEQERLNDKLDLTSVLTTYLKAQP